VTHRSLALPSVALLLAALGGCGKPAPAAPPTSSGSSEAYRLSTAADLTDAVPVLEVKEADPPLADGAEVAIVGRIRQMADGVLTVVDDREVHYCGKTEDVDCGCPTPWDYCCTNPRALKRASLTIEVQDAAGRSVPEDAMGLRLLDLIAVRGKLSKDEAGTLVLTSSGTWYRRERPELPDGLEWPE
jgi:hypothetical protein